MKKLMMVFAVVCASVTTMAASNGSQKSLISALRKSAAVRGAAAEAKKWASAPSCGPVRLESFDQDGKFLAIVDCHKPNTASPEENVGNEASGQAQITGVFSEGLLVIEKIEFSYAG